MGRIVTKKNVGFFAFITFTVNLIFLRLLIKQQPINVEGHALARPIVVTVGEETEEMFDASPNLCEVVEDVNKTWPLVHYKDMPELEGKLEELGVKNGGLWTCRNSDDVKRPPVGLLIPFRDRSENLRDFLGYIIPYFQDTGQSFHIFVINQVGQTLFNRAALLNAGYLEAKEINPDIGCFVYHDVDKVPMNYVNYSCSSQPVHMCQSLYREVPKSSTPLLLRQGFYYMYMGGVLAMPVDVLEQINGCTNLMYGWGGEDDNLYMRFMFSHVSVARIKDGKYLTLRHGLDKSNETGNRSVPLCQQLAKLRHYDGVSTIDYRLDAIEQHNLYTEIRVELPGPTHASEHQPVIERQIVNILDNMENKTFRGEMINTLSKYVTLLRTKNMTVI